MNPLSAFSFGRLIKSFMPGVIALAALTLAVEAGLHAWHPGGGVEGLVTRSLVRRVLTQQTTTAAGGAATVLMSVMLGFFLNTFAWQWVNDRLRTKADERLPDHVKQLRRGLHVYANRELDVFAGLLGDPRALAGLLGEAEVKRAPVPFFFPLVDFEKFSYIHESYFSWFEFQVNSAIAISLLALSLVGTQVSLWYQGELAYSAAACLIPGILVVASALVWILFEAGIRNLVKHQEYLTLFVAGSLLLAKLPERARSSAGHARATQRADPQAQDDE